MDEQMNAYDAAIIAIALCIILALASLSFYYQLIIIDIIAIGFKH